MNRKEMRKFEGKLRAQGKSPTEAKRLATLKRKLDERQKEKHDITEGDKVRLNIDKIKSHGDWDKMRDKYKEFVESNADTVFTVEYDKDKGKSVAVCLKEDTNDPKWLWWVGDLILVKKG